MEARAFDLVDFLAPGFDFDDVPSLWSLVRAQPLIAAFTALFRGGDEEIMIRLHVLREGRLPRGDPALGAGRAAPALFLHRASQARDGLETPARARSADLSARTPTTSSPTPAATHLAAVSALLRFGEDEDAELGFLTTQLAGMQATGTVSPEVLQHLLAKLNALTESFEEAVRIRFGVPHPRTPAPGSRRTESGWTREATSCARCSTSRRSPPTSAGSPTRSASRKAASPASMRPSSER